MGTGTRKLGFSGELVKLAVALALLVPASGFYASKAFAGDLSVQNAAPAQASSGSAVDSVLAQTNTLSQPEKSIWSDFHLSGFLNETDGMWINPPNLKQYTSSRNNLATARTWLQLDENFHLGADNDFFMREWFVYEPPYAFNTANNHIGNTLPFGANATFSSQANNDFYNQYTVRDAWWKLTAGPLTLYTGNQIVVWGQSLAFRVGDVINPQDTNWNFGFANLEQSRIPQWMIHPILNLPDAGPLSSNFLEGVLIPGVQPQWNEIDYPDGRFQGQMDVAGRVNQGFPASEHGASSRFDVHYPVEAYPGRSVTLTPGFPFGLYPSPGNIIPAPPSRMFYFCTNTPPGFAAVGPSLSGFLAATHQRNNTPARLQKPCTFQASAPVLKLGIWHVPAVQFKNMEEGLRFHTLLGSNELTAFFFYTQTYYPVISWVPYTNQFPAIFEPVSYTGVTWDRPVPMPASLAEYFPFVARAEATYLNHEPYSNFDTTQVNPLRFSDVLSYMLALDLDQAYAPWLTTTGNLSANVEVLDQIVLDWNQSLQGITALGLGGFENTTPAKNDVDILFNIGTSYWWNAVAPTWTMIYQVKGNTFAFFPSIQFNPPWTNKYFAKIGLVYVLGSDMGYGIGNFKGQNILTITGQYNFSVL